MSELENEIQEIEVSMEELQKHVDRAKVLERLTANKDFQQIVDEEYFKEEASRMLLLRDDPNLPADKKAFLEADLYGPGAFKRYLSTIFQLGRIAEDQIVDLRATVDQIHDQIAEEGGN